jgi:hypothetical protein
MSVTAPAQTDPFRAIRRFAGAQLVFAMVCTILVLWSLITASSADDAGLSLIIFAPLASSVTLPLALLHAARRGNRLAHAIVYAVEYVLCPYFLTVFAALSLRLLVMPLLEVGELMLGARPTPLPDAYLTTLAICLLIWPLHFLRPWRSRAARVARLCVAGLVAAWVVPVGRLSTAGETTLGLLAFMLLWLLAFALTTAVIRLCDAIWSGVAREGVPDGVTLLANASKPIPEYAGRGDRTVGIALSGGGYRASIFALGALMYVRDAISVAPGRRVAAVCSVSGGSLTNAVIAHSGSLDGQDGGEFNRAAGELLRHATGPGSMFRGLSGLYYFGLLVPTLLAFSGFILYGLRNIPIAIF